MKVHVERDRLWCEENEVKIQGKLDMKLPDLNLVCLEGDVAEPDCLLSKKYLTSEYIQSESISQWWWS